MEKHCTYYNTLIIHTFRPRGKTTENFTVYFTIEIEKEFG